MKAFKIAALSAAVSLLVLSCATAPTAVTGSVAGDILLAVKDGGNVRSGDPFLQMAGMNAAALYIPAKFSVSAQGEVSFSSAANLSGFQMTGGDGPVSGSVKLAQYSVSFSAKLPGWKGRPVTASLPLSKLLSSPTENLVVQALLKSGLSSGTFALQSVSYSALLQTGKAVVAVGP